MASRDVPWAVIEAAVGARCGKLSGLVSEVNVELVGLAKDLVRFAVECPEWRPFAEDMGTRALETAVEIAGAVQKLAAGVQRRAEADRDNPGPGRPA